tara:strand:+ start:564 stop:1043 length:480 start_codon:yes stop_codon:yes gene_type:complete
MEDILDKKTVIVSGSNTPNITLDIDPIKNVNSIKLVEIYVSLGAVAPKLTNIYICINDYPLKTIYSKDSNNNTIATNVFSNIIFFKGLNKNELNGTGIITDFNLDPQNYVFNPIKGELNRLNISFKELNTDNVLIDYTLDFNFSLELCIYSKRMKLTMF